MDEVSEYRRIIRRLIEQHAGIHPSVGDIQVETVLDETNDHHELLYSGWDGHRRTHGDALHLDIRGGKIWIQHDGTYDGIASELMEAGVPKDRIVLAFKSPEVRQYTGFAVS
jgi:hypothetical protein